MEPTRKKEIELDSWIEYLGDAYIAASSPWEKGGERKILAIA